MAINKLPQATPLLVPSKDAGLAWNKCWISVDICSAVHRGVSRDGRFVGGGARNQELDGDTRRRDSDLDRFGPSDRHNTLRPVSLVYCIEM